MSDLQARIEGYQKALNSIRRKLSLAGIERQGSAITMTEQAKQQILSLRSERAALWQLLKDSARDHLRFEHDITAAMVEVLPEDLQDKVLARFEEAGH